MTPLYLSLVFYSFLIIVTCWFLFSFINRILFFLVSMFISLSGYFFFISMFAFYVLFGLFFVFVGYLLGLSGFDSCSVMRSFECGFFTNDFISSCSSSSVFDVCLVFFLVEFELMFITVCILSFSFCGFLFFSCLFGLLSFSLVNDFWYYY